MALQFGHMLNQFSPGSIYDHRAGSLVGPAEIRSLVHARAVQLRDSQISAGTRVLLLKGNGLDFFVDLFALWEIGACVVPGDAKSKDPEVDYAVELCGIDFLLTEHKEAHFPNAVKPVNFQENVALILMSSGTTGRPKAVMHTRDSVQNRISSLTKLCSPEEVTRTLCLLPVHFGHGLIANSLFPFLHGANLFIYPAFNQEICLRLGELVDKHQITFMSSVPAVWNIAGALSAPPSGDSLRRVCCASSALSEGTFAKIQAWCPPGTKITNVYGTTETASWVSGVSERAGYTSGWVGKPWEAKISCDEEGVVSITSESTMLGYCNDPVGTAAVLKNGQFYTEDLGRLNEEGSLTLLGRLGDTIHKAGLKVHPIEVEECLSEHPAVKDVCVFACSHEVSGENVAAAIVFREPLPFSALEAWCRERISSFKVPDRWFSVPTIPRNARGKVNRKEMRDQCLK